MKLLAQHGASNGDKTARGLEKGYVDGVIYSPRDVTAPKLQEHLAEAVKIKANSTRLFDPQYYACYNVSPQDARLGRLATCEEYGKYFKRRRRNELEGDTATLKRDIENCIEFQSNLDLTALIAPNILITRSFDSIEAVIAKNFIRFTGSVAEEVHASRPVYATLAVSREALLDKTELLDFLTDITLLDHPPGGFYVLVASRSEDARSDIFNADVIAGWMLLNHTLAINGYEVINGYSDIITPFLGMAGATAGATGWWSNLRTFSLNRFLPAGGGRLPIQRYLSGRLLNRVTFFELNQLRSRYSDILNGLETDALYPEDRGSEPDRADEVLQTWQTLKTLNDDLVRRSVGESMAACREAIAGASAAYDEIQATIRLDQKSNADHLPAILEGIRVFSQLAEMEGTTLEQP